MRLLRGLAGALLWIVSLLLMLVGVILCVTVLLLPLGIPLLGYARRIFSTSLKLMLPRAVSHPVKASDEATEKRRRRASKQARHNIVDARRGAARIRRRSAKKAKRVRKKRSLVA